MSLPDAVQSARAQLSPGQPAGVTEAMIAQLVHGFYAKVRQDQMLAPIFAAAIDDWDPHLQTMCDFWSSVTLMSGRYHGAPMQAHARHTAIRPEHFARWLELFVQTARELCPPPAAALFEDRAHRIGESLQLGMAAARGELPPLHQRGQAAHATGADAGTAAVDSS